MYLAQLCRRHETAKAIAYASKVGIPMPPWYNQSEGGSPSAMPVLIPSLNTNSQGGRGLLGALAGNGNDSTATDKIKNSSVLKLGDTIHLHDGSLAILLPYTVKEPVVEVEGAKEKEERLEFERTHIPEFKPKREVLPVGVRWAVVTREATNRYLKQVRFEDNGLEEGMWVTARQLASGLANRGRWGGVWWCDFAAKGMGGWVMWVR